MSLPTKGSKKPSITHVIGGLHAGGAETLLYRLVTRPSEFSHEVVSLLPPDWYSKPLQEAGVPVHHLGIGSIASALKAVPRLRRLIAKADVVQTWMYTANVYGGLVARTAGVPAVWGIHAGSLGPLGMGSKLWAIAGGIAAGFVPAHIVNCSVRSAQLHRKLGYGLGQGSVIPNGYDPSGFDRDDKARAVTRAALNYGPNDFVVGCIGRWHKQKDIPNLLRAIRLAADAGVPAHCLLVGRDLDPSNSEFRSLLEETKTADLTRALGRRPDVEQLARAMDVHLLASCGGEAFPNAVGETMLSETPNIVTDVGDSGLIVGDTGWVVPPSNPGAIAAAIEQAWLEWKDRPVAWEARRSASRQRIIDNFTFDRMVAAYEKVWDEVYRSR